MLSLNVTLSLILSLMIILTLIALDVPRRARRILPTPHSLVSNIPPNMQIKIITLAQYSNEADDI